MTINVNDLAKSPVKVVNAINRLETKTAAAGEFLTTGNATTITDRRVNETSVVLLQQTAGTPRPFRVEPAPGAFTVYARNGLTFRYVVL